MEGKFKLNHTEERLRQREEQLGEELASSKLADQEVQRGEALVRESNCRKRFRVARLDDNFLLPNWF